MATNQDGCPETGDIERLIFGGDAAYCSGCGKIFRGSADKVLSDFRKHQKSSLRSRVYRFKRTLTLFGYFREDRP